MRQADPRFDFTGGLNLASSGEVLDRREVRMAMNMRHGEIGALATRSGSQRIHATAIGGGAAVQGVTFWEGPDGDQVVAIAGGNLYYKTVADEEFEEVPGDFSLTARPRFARHVLAGVPTLFIADGTLWKWSGVALDTVDDAPGAVDIATYKTRMFAIDGSKNLYWAGVGQPELWPADDGGQASIETYDTEGIVGLVVAGSSLLPMKEDTIARFTGVVASNIRIDQETDGLSDEVGAVARTSIIRREGAAFFISDRGPYFASDSRVEPAGAKIEAAFDAASRAYMPYAVAVRHKGQRETWAFIPSANSEENDVGYVHSDRVGSWTGPWSFEGFNVCSACSHERADGTKSVLVGGYDGFVRDADLPDVGCRDDVLSDGTGGTLFRWRAEWSPLLFGNPAVLKTMSPDSEFALDLGDGGEAVVRMSSEEMGEVAERLVSVGEGVHQYQVRTGAQGRRIDIAVEGASPNPAQINGIRPVAHLGRSSS